MSVAMFLRQNFSGAIFIDVFVVEIKFEIPSRLRKQVYGRVLLILNSNNFIAGSRESNSTCVCQRNFNKTLAVGTSFIAHKFSGRFASRAGEHTGVSLQRFLQRLCTHFIRVHDFNDAIHVSLDSRWLPICKDKDILLLRIFFIDTKVRRLKT